MMYEGPQRGARAEASQGLITQRHHRRGTRRCHTQRNSRPLLQLRRCCDGAMKSKTHDHVIGSQMQVMLRYRFQFLVGKRKILSLANDVVKLEGLKKSGNVTLRTLIPANRAALPFL